MMRDKEVMRMKKHATKNLRIERIETGSIDRLQVIITTAD